MQVLGNGPEKTARWIVSAADSSCQAANSFSCKNLILRL